MSASIETATLDYTATYDPDRDFDSVYTRATGRRIAKALRRHDRVLELGCATGLMTTFLAGDGREVVAVDRSAPYLDRLGERGLDGVTTVLADVDGFEPCGRFDHVVMTSLLHEVADPGALLTRARGWLRHCGRVHLTLQNPHSIHRLVAIEMGLLERPHETSERGQLYGTQRMLDADALVALGEQAGLRVCERGGVLLKPLPNSAMAELAPQVLEGFERVAHHFPEHCAMTYLMLEAR